MPDCALWKPQCPHTHMYIHCIPQHPYLPHPTRPPTPTTQEGEAFPAMYERGGLLASEDAGVSVLAGATLGGGTRVNWSASFATPPHVRREWAERFGLPAFASPRYDAALAAVGARLGVRTGFRHRCVWGWGVGGWGGACCSQKGHGQGGCLFAALNRQDNLA